MEHLVSERIHVFGERHQAIDLLRHQRESGGSFAVYPAAVRALLQEIDLLQVVAQAAEHLAAFPADQSAGEALTQLRHSVRRWKE